MGRGPALGLHTSNPRRRFRQAPPGTPGQAARDGAAQAPRLLSRQGRVPGRWGPAPAIRPDTTRGSCGRGRQLQKQRQTQERVRRGGGAPSNVLTFLRASLRSSSPSKCGSCSKAAALSPDLPTWAAFLEASGTACGMIPWGGRPAVPCGPGCAGPRGSTEAKSSHAASAGAGASRRRRGPPLSPTPSCLPAPSEYKQT